jgi:uncharacterized membrane protein
MTLKYVLLEDGTKLDLTPDFGLESINESENVDMSVNMEGFHSTISAHMVAFEALCDLHSQVTDAGETVSEESRDLTAVTMESICASAGYDAPAYEPATGITVEHINASMEEISKGLGNVVARYKVMVARFYHPLNTLLARNITKLSKLSDRAAAKTVSGDIAVPAKYLGREGNRDLVRYYTHVADTLQLCVGRYHEEAFEDFQHNLDTARKLFGEANSTFESTAGRLLESWKDPRHVLSMEQMALVYPNGSRLFVNESLKYKGDNAVARKFDEIAFHNYPTMIGSTGSGESGKGTVRVKAFTGAEIKAIATKFRVASATVSSMESIAEKVVSLINSNYMPLMQIIAAFVNRVGNPKEDRAAFKAEIKTVKDALYTAQRLAQHTGFDSARVLLKAGSIFMKVASMSLDWKDDKVSNESAEVATDISNETLAGGVIGGLAGTLVLPVVGTAIGAYVGNKISNTAKKEREEAEAKLEKRHKEEMAALRRAHESHVSTEDATPLTDTTIPALSTESVIGPVAGSLVGALVGSSVGPLGVLTGAALGAVSGKAVEDLARGHHPLQAQHDAEMQALKDKHAREKHEHTSHTASIESAIPPVVVPQAEAALNVSTEAMFKLKTGMKVKYSGGYGKIVKIFDRPTKYHGEIHHCTKDSPKYEVKADTGSHLSLHKAGALTVIA